jgi:hypothetical protein
MNNKRIPRLVLRLKSTLTFAPILLVLLLFAPSKSASQTKPFHLMEATIEDIHNAYRSGRLTSHQLVQLYLNRIEAYDKKGPGLNAIITINPKALEEADRLDAAFKASGFVGPLHGIPVILKDQMDAKGMPTTLGSILFKDYYPDRDAFVTDKLRKAGAIILAKGTLGELGGGEATRLGPYLALHEIRMRWIEPREGLQAGRVRVLQQTSRPWQSERRALHRSADHRPGTLWWG